MTRKDVPEYGVRMRMSAATCGQCKVPLQVVLAVAIAHPRSPSRGPYGFETTLYHVQCPQCLVSLPIWLDPEKAARDLRALTQQRVKPGKSGAGKRTRTRSGRRSPTPE